MGNHSGKGVSKDIVIYTDSNQMHKETLSLDLFNRYTDQSFSMNLSDFRERLTVGNIQEVFFNEIRQVIQNEKSHFNFRLVDLSKLKQSQSYIILAEKNVITGKVLWKRKLNLFEKPFKYLFKSNT